MAHVIVIDLPMDIIYKYFVSSPNVFNVIDFLDHEPVTHTSPFIIITTIIGT